MAQLTLTELVAVLAQCAGVDEDVDLGGDILQTPFFDLGYDSLALLETSARVAERYGITLTDDEVSTMETPGAFLELVNNRLSARV
jgi:act minimal PKS acyl carrier protein